MIEAILTQQALEDRRNEDTREWSYQIHAKSLIERGRNINGYVVWRGLNTQKWSDVAQGNLVHTEEGYNQYLPKYRERNLEEVIDLQVKDKGFCRIVDLGCGEGRMLLDLVNKWPGQVDATGISAFPYHQRSNRLNYTPTEDELKEKGIKICIGDVQLVDQFVKECSVDVVTGCFVAQYVADPWQLLQATYSILNQSGVGLFNLFPTSVISKRTKVKQYEKAVQVLKEEYGVELDFTGSSVLKGHPKVVIEKARSILDLPLFNPETKLIDGFKRVAYTYDERISI